MHSVKASDQLHFETSSWESYYKCKELANYYAMTLAGNKKGLWAFPPSNTTGFDLIHLSGAVVTFVQVTVSHVHSMKVKQINDVIEALMEVTKDLRVEIIVLRDMPGETRIYPYVGLIPKGTKRGAARSKWPNTGAEQKKLIESYVCKCIQVE